MLELTETMTLIANQPVPDAVFDAAKAQLTDQELAAVMMTIVAINGWNRIAITSGTPLD